LSSVQSVTDFIKEEERATVKSAAEQKIKQLDKHKQGKSGAITDTDKDFKAPGVGGKKALTITDILPSLRESGVRI
ncbi:hypothetical protein H8E50_04645, partial [bacterium]|nr:hypothetical protein [bacterium]